MLTDNNIINLTDIYTRDHLFDNQFPLVKRFVKSAFFVKEMLEIPLVLKASELMAVKRTLTKPELGTVCFFIFYNREIFKAFLSSMPAWFDRLMEKLLWQRELHRDEVEKIVGAQLINIPRTGNNYDYLPELKFFNIRNITSVYNNWGKTWEQAYAAKPVVFSLPTHLKKIIADFYPKPEGHEFKASTTLIDKENSTIFNAESAILQEFSTLASYYLQDNIKYSERGRPSVSGLKKIQRTLALKEIYIHTDPELHPVRTMLLVGMLYDLKHNDMYDSTPFIIKKIFVEHFTKNRHPSTIANFIINQVKGINYLSDHDYSKEAAPIFWNLMTSFPKTGWVTWDNIEVYLQSRFLEPQPIYGHSLSRLYYEDNSGRGSRIPIDNNNRTPMLQWTFMKGCIFLLAAFGMVEMSLTVPDTKELGKTWFSEYDGLQSLRLTALGRYVLTKNGTYQPPPIDDAAKMVFDEESLTITTIGNMDLTTMLLGNYVEKITANRFAFKPTLFLRDCKNVNQIENKIALFRKSLNIKLPAFWEKELKELVSNAKAVIEQNDFFVFKINETDKGLLRTIAQDNQLKAIIIKAERFFVLVDKKNKTVFKNRLVELGYFIES